MKLILGVFLTAILLAVSFQAHAQGTLTFDQESASSPATAQQIDGFNLQEDSPLVQSFVPSFSAVGFVQLQFFDISGNGNNGATVYVNLWTGSPNINSATLLGSTTTVYMPNGFGNNGFSPAVASFYFQNPVTVNSGQTYYFQPVVQSGDDPWDIAVLADTYPNGELSVDGHSIQPGSDLWFREGIAVPEPMSLTLLGFITLLFIAGRRWRYLLFVVGISTPIVAYADTYYLQSYGGVGSIPWPVNPYGASVTVEQVSTNVYLVADGAPAGGRFHANTMSLSGHPFRVAPMGLAQMIFSPAIFIRRLLPMAYGWRF